MASAAAAELEVAITKVVGQKDDDVGPLAAISDQRQDKKWN